MKFSGWLRAVDLFGRIVKEEKAIPKEKGCNLNCHGAGTTNRIFLEKFLHGIVGIRGAFKCIEGFFTSCYSPKVLAKFDPTIKRFVFPSV